MNTIESDAESEILERAVSAENAHWSPEAARAILAFKLADSDLRQADDLAAKARAGSLAPEEQNRLQNYLHLGRIIEFMKVKAVLSLKAKGFAY